MPRDATRALGDTRVVAGRTVRQNVRFQGGTTRQSGVVVEEPTGVTLA